MKDLLTMILVSAICLLLTLSAAHASAIRLRSTNVIDEQTLASMHMADGILRDLMMNRGDHNGDNKLSANEIAWFYRNIVRYSDYVSRKYGDSFISIADQNRDNLLDPHELLRMLVAMNAVDILKRWCYVSKYVTTEDNTWIGQHLSRGEKTYRN